MSFAICWVASAIVMVLAAKLNVLGFVSDAASISRKTAAVLLDSETSEAVKESAAQTGAAQIAWAAAQIWLRLALALAVASLLPLWAVWMRWTDTQSLSQAFLSWQTLAISSATLLAVFYCRP